MSADQRSKFFDLREKMMWPTLSTAEYLSRDRRPSFSTILIVSDVRSWDRLPPSMVASEIVARHLAEMHASTQQPSLLKELCHETFECHYCPTSACRPSTQR